MLQARLVVSPPATAEGLPAALSALMSAKLYVYNVPR